MPVLDLSPLQGQHSEMENRLSHVRKSAGFTQDGLAKALNTGRSTVTKLERSEIPMTDRWLDRLSKVLKCSASDILGDYVAVVGKIGAGGSVIFEDTGNEDRVSRPPDTKGELVGLEVVGESMLPKFDPGDVVYISRDRDGVDNRDIGAICACRLATGETYLKQLMRGTAPGLWTLRSYNAADISDIVLQWATPIVAVTFRHARGF
jgi:phage repressor protein C with HTH and peptisase S24 domain